MENITTVKMGFGKNKLDISIPTANLADVLTPNAVEVDLTGEDEVKRALSEPIGSEKLSKLYKKGAKVVIITSDITRPVPSKYIVPHIIDELVAGGADLCDITVVFALGSHRSHTEEEMRYLVGDATFERVRCIDSSMERCVRLGVTSRGTPLDVFEEVANADMRICVGNIEYHYFAGYSGGAKAIMPGVSSRDAIQANHSRMVESTSVAGKIEGNNVRADIDEAGKIVGIDFIVNVVLNEKKEIICAVAGDYIKAHRAGCEFLDKLYKKELPKKADIVLVSPGGYPKDINLYQSQKGLDNAAHAVRDGGIIILLASAKEGLGEHVFEEWLNEAKTSHELVERIAREFKLGGHKAAAIAMVLERAKIFMVSDQDDDFVKNVFMDPYHSVDEALSAAFKELGDDAKVLVMPYGGSTLPVVKE